MENEDIRSCGAGCRPYHPTQGALGECNYGAHIIKVQLGAKCKYNLPKESEKSSQSKSDLEYRSNASGCRV